MRQLDPLYDAAAGVPAAVDVKPLLDALRGSQWWTGSALDLAGHGQKDAAEFLEKLLEVMLEELRHRRQLTHGQKQQKNQITGATSTIGSNIGGLGQEFD